MKHILLVSVVLCPLTMISCGPSNINSEQWKGTSYHPKFLAISMDCRTLATAMTTDLQVWDVGKGQHRATLQGHEFDIWCLAFSTDGKVLASADRLGHIILWDLLEGKKLTTLQETGAPVIDLAFSRDGSILVSSNRDSTANIKLWEVRTGKEVAILSPDIGMVEALNFSPDGKILAMGGGKGGVVGYRTLPITDCEIRLWDWSAQKQVGVLAGHTSFILDLTFSSDGGLLASGSRDQTARIWDLATGKERFSLGGLDDGCSQVQFTPDDTILVTYNGGLNRPEMIKIWNVKTGFELASVTDIAPKMKNLEAGENNLHIDPKIFQFTPDGKQLLSVDWKRNVRLWELAKLIDKSI